VSPEENKAIVRRLIEEGWADLNILGMLGQLDVLPPSEELTK
jgi:hypothetical protein